MPKRILLVDDDSSSLELSRQALDRAGHQVVTASSGLEGRYALELRKFDLVITDIFMPDMDGLELIRHICHTGQTMPIIAVSGGDEMLAGGFLDFALALGADAVLQKPVVPDVLLEAVEHVVIDPTKNARRMTRPVSDRVMANAEPVSR